MAHFAQLDENNLVINVVVVNNEAIDNLPFPDSEPVGIAFLQELNSADTKWAQTSYNNNFRFRYAGIGYTFDAALNAFIPAKPFPSWHMDTTIANWAAPVPYPNDGKRYNWDETTQSWVEFNIGEP